MFLLNFEKGQGAFEKAKLCLCEQSPPSTIAYIFMNGLIRIMTAHAREVGWYFPMSPAH